MKHEHKCLPVTISGYSSSDHQFANSLLIHARMTTECSGIINNQPYVESSSPFDEIHSDHEESDSQIIPANPFLHRSMNVWSYNQTKYFIKSMATYYTDFNDPRKHVANDLQIWTKQVERLTEKLYESQGYQE